VESERDETELREELGRVETDLEELRATARRLRQEVGERWFEPTDATERAAMITAAEEQEAFAEALAARRDELSERLGEQS